MTQSSSQFLNILVPWCQAGHMVCKAVFQVLSSAIDHVLLNNNLIVPCALLKESREKERGCHHTSTQSKRILPIQTTKGHDFPLAVALLISYFYICFLWQFFFFFLLKRCGNLVLMQLETGSSSSGNKSLCFSTVSLRHGAGYWPGTTTNGWKPPEESDPPCPPQSPPPTLPNVSQELRPAEARCFGFLTSGWKNVLLLTLTEKKKNNAILISQ